ncbi:MAG: HWE histidine kinase domain-containing protein, partial [Cyanobacteria bacterium P01_D01_bin.56]
MADDAKQLLKSALSNCAREPVHIPGAIQSFGALVVTDESLENITHVSTNLATVLGRKDWDCAQVLGEDIHLLLPSDLVHDLCNACSLSTIESQRELLGSYQIQGQWLDVSVHVRGDRTLVELIPTFQGRQRQSAASVLKIRTILDPLTETQKLLSRAVLELRKAIGFDRVMVYRFLTDGAGEVVAEACAEELEPYLGLRYPAHDIPEPMRVHARQVPLRVIADAQAASVPLLSVEPEADPLDLSLVLTRGVIAPHGEYLTNMGTVATMSMAIVLGDKLWGLFACHHSQPKHLSQEHLAVVELFGQLFSLKLQQVLTEEEFRDRKRTAYTLSQILATPPTNGHWQTIIIQAQEQLCELLAAHGVAIVAEQAVISTYGDVPEKTAVLSLISHYHAETEKGITPVESLKQLDLYDTWSPIAGALILSLHATAPHHLVFFRREITQEIRWGGKPKEHKIIKSIFGPRLQPRESFAEYKETVQDRCRPWNQRDLAVALEIRTELIRLAEYRIQAFQQRQQNLLIAELNHRVKNILALIRSIARQTMESTDSLAEYTTNLEKRITALSAAHDLVSGHDELEWPEMQKLLMTELQPYLSDIQPQVTFSGQKVSLQASLAPTFVLIVHELVSNAVKYGALSTATGQLDIRWNQTDGDDLSFVWQEFNGPMVTQPNRRGFGCNLIERAIPYEFEGEAR